MTRLTRSSTTSVVVPTARPPKKLFFGNRQPHLPNVERNRPPQDTFLLSQEIYRPPCNNPPRNTDVTCSAHLQTYGSVFFVLCSLYFIVFCIVVVRFRRTLFIVLNGFGVSGLKRNSNHKLERRDDPFKLRENGTNGFGAETQPQPQTILKSKRNPKRNTVCGVSSLSENVNIVNLKSEPQRETQTQQRAWFSWHSAARGAVRDSHTRRRHGTRAGRSIGTGTSSWSYRTHDAV